MRCTLPPRAQNSALNAATGAPAVGHVLRHDCGVPPAERAVRVGRQPGLVLLDVGAEAVEVRRGGVRGRLAHDRAGDQERHGGIAPRELPQDDAVRPPMPPTTASTWSISTSWRADGDHAGEDARLACRPPRARPRDRRRVAPRTPPAGPCRRGRRRVAAAAASAAASDQSCDSAAMPVQSARTPIRNGRRAYSPQPAAARPRQRARPASASRTGLERIARHPDLRRPRRSSRRPGAHGDALDDAAARRIDAHDLAVERARRPRRCPRRLRRRRSPAGRDALDDPAARGIDLTARRGRIGDPDGARARLAIRCGVIGRGYVASSRPSAARS